MLTLPAYAKINLVLEALGKREDGYHQVATVMQTISLQDTLSFQLVAEGISLRCSIPGLASPDNLVLRAAYMLQDTTGCKKGARISLEKRIPLASGLGGGSSDAAATLKALNELWGLHLAPERLAELAAGLGSDVPFFISGGTCLVEGRGEKVTPLPPLPRFWLVLLKPPLEVSNKTAQLYARLLPQHFTAGEHVRKMVEFLHQSREVPLWQRSGDLPHSPHLSAFPGLRESDDRAFKRGEAPLAENSPSPLERERGIKGVRVEDKLSNVFEKVAFSFFPGLEGYRQLLLASGAVAVHLSGSGPTLFTLVSGRVQGEKICSRLKFAGGETFLVQMVPGTRLR